MKEIMRLLPIGLFIAASVAAQNAPPRLAQMSKDGKITLSLDDAIALALENNLDVALERLTPEVAAQDLKRAEAGALLRGIPSVVREGPRATGGATGQVQGLTALTATTPVAGTSAEQNLNVAGAIPLATGVSPPGLDPTLTGELSWKHASQPQVVSFLAGVPAVDTNNLLANAGLNWGFLTGGTLVATFNNARTSSNSLRNDLNPYATSNLGATFTQPLLRGAGKTLNSRFIRIARNNGKVADLLFKQQVIGTTTVVIQLYWDYVALRDDLDNRKHILDFAVRLLNDQQEQLKSGVIPPVDVARAQAEVARSRRDLAAAKTLVAQQGNVLKEYISGSRADSTLLDSLELLPAEAIPDVPANELTQPISELVARAIKKRPDYEQARIQVANSRISIEGSRNAVKPQLDVYVTVQNNSLSGAVSDLPLSTGNSAFILPRTPNAAFIGNYADNLGQLFRRNYPDYGAGIRFHFPIRNRVAEADIARDEIEVKRQNIRVELLEKDVRVDIKNALSALSQAREALSAAGEERKAQQQVVAAEKERLAVGVTNATTVIQYERDLVQSQAAELTARASLIKAKALLDRALGDTLDVYNISIDATHNARIAGGGAK